MAPAPRTLMHIKAIDVYHCPLRRRQWTSSFGQKLASESVPRRFGLSDMRKLATLNGIVGHILI